MSSPQSTLGRFDSVCIIVGIIVGVGIYEASPLIAASLPSSGWVLGMWLLGGVFSLAGALCYAELAALFPKVGGDYIYLKKAYGEMFAFLFGWSRFIVIRPGSIAAMAFPFATYALTLWNPFQGTPMEGNSKIIVAILAVLILTALNSFQISAGKNVQNLLTLIKVLGLLLLFLLPLFGSGNGIENLTIVKERPTWDFGLALILVLFTFGGWSEIAFVAGEVKNPSKNILWVLVSGVLAVTLLYLLVNFSFLYALGLSDMSQSQAVATDAVATLLSESAGTAISILICISALGALQGLIFTGARVSFALGEDSGILSSLARWDQNRGGPVVALWAQAALSIFIIFVSGSFTGAVLYTSAIVWFFYACVGLGVILLRYQLPEMDRPYRTHGYPLTVIVFIASCLYLTYSSVAYDLEGTCISLVFVLSGLLIYWGDKRSEDPQSNSSLG